MQAIAGMMLGSTNEAKICGVQAAVDDLRAGIVGVIAAGLVDRPEMARLATRLALIRYIRRQAYADWEA